MLFVLLQTMVVATPWTQLDVQDGVTLDGRRIDGSPYLELRATMMLEKFPLEAMCRGAFGDGTPSTPDVKTRKTLKDESHERIYYDTLVAPVVADRDYVLRHTWELRGDQCFNEFKTANELAPPVPDGFVRIEKLWGSVLIEPAGDRMRLRYIIMTDVAGSIPPFMVEGARKKGAFEEIRRIAARATASGRRAAAEAKAAPAATVTEVDGGIRAAGDSSPSR